MKRTTKAKGIALALTLLSLSFPWVASADPIYVEYEIGPYSTRGYSASYIHGSTGCRMAGELGTLYTCGNPLISITGSIAGWLDDGVLRRINGYLTNGDFVLRIRGGRLGPFDSGDFSGFRFANGDRAIFEPFNMGSGRPNYFDGDEFILWGQNRAAYNCRPGQTKCGRRFGLDLYGTRVTVPEPGTLALFGIGLIGMGMARRRRTV